MKAESCAICHRNLGRSDGLTLLSTSSSGRVVIAYVCKKCSENPSKMASLMKHNDAVLNRLDYPIIAG